MVVSNLDDSIIYQNIKSVDNSDLGFDASLYEINLMPKISGIIALGNVKYTFSAKNILYIPVYLVNDGEITIQIGVYEFSSSQYPNLLDEDNDFDISKLPNTEPLFYSFVNKNVLLSNGGTEIMDYSVMDDEEKEEEKAEEDDEDSEDEEDSEEEEDSEDDEEDDEDNEENKEEGDDSEEDNEEDEEAKKSNTTLSKQISLDVIDILKKFTAEDDGAIDAIDKTMNTDMMERKKFKKEYNNNWVQNFMKNKLYNIVDNEAGGDCLFAVIRDALKSVDIDVSVSDLRKIISKNASEKVFNDFREQYNMYTTEIVSTMRNMKDLASEIEDLRQEKRGTKDRNRQKTIVEIAKKKITDFKRIKREHNYAKELLSDYDWMEGVDNLVKFKSVLRTCRFWAEAWAINLLEKALNIKLIILSSENYKAGDMSNVLLCDRGFVDAEIIKNRSFAPKFYIMADYTGNHYKLITYGDNHIYTFSEIPYSIKMLVVEKCMEKNSGIYQFIPKFEAFKKQIFGKKIEEDAKDTQVTIPNSLTMYDPTTVFQFYSKSSNKPKPGEGSGETIKSENASKFADLASLKGWRKTLSNFYISPFILDNHKWNSVEHYYQGSKFKKNNPEFYLKFSLDSGSDLSKDPVLAKSYGGKTGKYKGKIVRAKEIKIDPDFFGPNGRSEKEMEAAQAAKYSQSNEAKKTLLATKDAKLVHYSRGAPPVVFNDIMSIRSTLS